MVPTGASRQAERPVSSDNREKAPEREAFNQGKIEQLGELRPEKVREVQSKLHGMVGMERVAAEVDSLIAEAVVNRQRAESGLPVDVSNYHMVFTGNPGTGKTTVARDIAQIYNALGILPTNKFVEAKRVDLVGGFAGQTAIKTKKLFDSAKGGVLFIDEAYALKQGPNDSYGQEAIDTLLAEIENNKADTVVIVAGYPKEMKGFIETNPGLNRRFPTKIDFKNYSQGELSKIMGKMLSSGKYTIGSGDSAKKTRRMIDERLAIIAENPASGNAGDVNNFYSRIKRAQSLRLSQVPAEDRDLKTITPEDVAVGWAMMSDTLDVKPVKGKTKKGSLVKS